MEMESTRRPFERPNLKKPRLAQVEEPIDRNILMRKFRAENDRERFMDSDDSGRGSFSQDPQIQELVDQYRIALAELTSNSKPIITNLTIIAGENLHAAKAIAGTVCANILEVPSDQKLPSLYLLDSIVKNIGRDYIKYFGAKLPEVFCRAYRQVDPSTHPGMRHLFGTWKGVFPPQPLQMIEKELGFSHAANGSSSGSVISRSESQSQRPPQSIHVNPKYLEERQRLQQPSRDVERLDRAVGLSSGRQWSEPTLKTQSTQRQRDAPDEYIREKNIIAAYGNYDPDSDHSSQSGLEIGRVKDRVIDKTWYEANNNLEEKMSVRRNGIDNKQGFLKYAPPIAEKINLNILPRRSISGKSNSGIDESWKNSDEEEYLWDDLNSKSSHHPSVGISNRPGLENGLRRPQNLHEIGSRMERESSADALSTERKNQEYFRNRRSPSWTEEPHLIQETISSVSDSRRLSHSEGFINPLSGISMPVDSLKRRPIPSHMSPSHISTSTFSHLNNPEIVPPVSVGQKRPFVSDYLAEQDFQQSQLPRRPELKKPQFCGTVNAISQFSHQTPPPRPQDTLTAKSPKFPPKNLQTSTPLVLLDQSSKKNLVDSKMKKDMPLKKPGKSKTLSPSTRNPPLPSGPPAKITRTDPRLIAESSNIQPSQTKLSAFNPPSKIKFVPPKLPPTSPPSSQASDSASDPVSSLLSTLMAKGLITASKSESPTSDKKITMSNNIVLPDKNEPPESAAKLSVKEVKPLIGLEFKPDLIRKSHLSVINEFFQELPHQCDSCGLRFKLEEQFKRHLEWHALRKPEANFQDKNSRKWYANQENWVAGKDETCSRERTSDEPEEREEMVPADENQCACVLCGEIFEDIYCQKTNEWMFKGAVYLPLGDSTIGTSSGSGSKGPIVHSNCISENSREDLGFPSA